MGSSIADGLMRRGPSRYSVKIGDGHKEATAISQRPALTMPEDWATNRNDTDEVFLAEKKEQKSTPKRNAQRRPYRR